MPHIWTHALTQAGIAAGVAIAVALAIHLVLFALLLRIVRFSQLQSDGVVVRRLREPIRWSLMAIAISLAGESVPALAHGWEGVARFLVPALLGWIAFSLVKAYATIMESRAELAIDELAERSRRTRVAILSRTAGFIIVFVTVALMLLGIPGVRSVGVTLMASAGLAGLAVGAAAQPALKALMAGVRMAISQPIRIGDLVIVDGQTGRVEAIEMNFVVLKTWNERSIVVPTSRFLDASFENWSLVPGGVTGAVLLHLDPAMDVAPVRAEFERLLALQPLWDGRTGVLAVTEARPESIELRLAMTAANNTSLFELRCIMREAMLDWLRREMPDALVRRGLAPTSTAP